MLGAGRRLSEVAHTAVGNPDVHGVLLAGHVACASGRSDSGHTRADAFRCLQTPMWSRKARSPNTDSRFPSPQAIIVMEKPELMLKRLRFCGVRR